MSFPLVLKNFALFIDGQGYMGETEEFTPPKITSKMEEIRTGGWLSAVEVELGKEKMEASFVMPGFATNVIRKMQNNTIGGLPFRFAAAAQRDDTNQVSAVTYHLRGRIKELDQGSFKAGEVNKSTFTIACSYLKIVENGVTVLEFDPIHRIFKVDGNDLLQALNIAMGLGSVI